jgi:GalNAc-alpha-(1->4)-GalNAc-alpha-(1->3)-diNAcBac-PP-undecaprenol alpha-1,4-N-acetyl-D-galactosaminyltransferase
MKILFVISSLSAGGAERVVSLLANRLCRQHQVAIATYSREKPFYILDERIRHLKLDLLSDSPTPLHTFLNTWHRIRRLKEVFLKEKPDVIVSFMSHTNLLAIFAAKTVRIPIVVSERVAYDFYGSSMLNIARRALYPFADALVVQTEGDRKHYPFVPKTFVIPNPVAVPVKVRPMETRERIVLAVGRLEYQKGFDLLIPVFGKLESKDWRLVIVGEGSQRRELETLIEKANADNIRLVGRQKEMEEWYQKASIFVLPSRREGFPNVLLEAMAHGCACIAFDCPYGPSEIIENGENGLLIEWGNEQALMEKLKRLMDDMDLRKKIQVAAHESSKEFCPEKVLLLWEKLMEDLKNYQ